MTFSNLRRFIGFRKQLGKGKREAKLIVNSEKKETMVYNAKEQILRAKLFLWILEFAWDKSGLVNNE